NKIYPEEIARAHKEGSIHIHDLGYLSVYCVGWDLQELIMVGFRGVPGKVESRPAKHFRTLLGQIVNFFYTMQGEAAGAQAFSNFDTYLAPFIRYDGLSYNEVKQALQEFMFNMNVPTRVGFQTPFTNVTLDLVVPENMKNLGVIIGGKMQDSVYGDYQPEMDMFNKAFAEVMTEGDANGRIFSFPIPTYNITRDFDWDNASREPIWEMTAKYGIPYFSNFVNSDMSPDDVRSMCCRLRLDTTELKSRGGGLFGANPLTGSIGVVTLNLPRVAYESKTEDEFYQKVEKLMVLAKESLEIKRKLIEKLTEDGLYPYSRFYLRNIKLRNGSYWDNHFSTIGLIGMNEALLNFWGVHIATMEGKARAEKLMDFMREKLQEFQQETGHIYNLEATPAEGTTYRLAQLDKAQYPDIITANEEQVRENGSAPYYTNSSQLPVGITDDIFEALEWQDSLQTKYTGGTVFHTFVGESRLPPASVKKLVKVVCENFKLPYFTLTPTFSICPEHGYIYGEHRHCPKCEAEGKQNKCEVYSRIVGYLRPVDQWNNGKQAEFTDRKLFDKKIEVQPLLQEV
ncbi:MAG TPA: ribonucleoside triphosphate reductase, partial [Bacteroidetes bacterium]|nr:ribonucleoside triphosphate reductase [Bacteroidota bacterium]